MTVPVLLGKSAFESIFKLSYFLLLRSYENICLNGPKMRRSEKDKAEYFYNAAISKKELRVP